MHRISVSFIYNQNVFLIFHFYSYSIFYNLSICSCSLNKSILTFFFHIYFHFYVFLLFAFPSHSSCQTFVISNCSWFTPLFLPSPLVDSPSCSISFLIILYSPIFLYLFIYHSSISQLHLSQNILCIYFFIVKIKWICIFIKNIICKLRFNKTVNSQEL